MIVFVTTADTEILALSRVARDLPEGFPALQAVNPTRLPAELGPAELVSGAVMVLVRLLLPVAPSSPLSLQRLLTSVDGVSVEEATPEIQPAATAADSQSTG